MTGTELMTRGSEVDRATDSALVQAVLKAPWMMRIENHPSWEILSQLRVTMRAGVALNGFRVKDLLAMKEGQVFETASPATEDVPVRVGRVQLGWSEFEVVQQRMSLRLTRLG